LKEQLFVDSIAIPLKVKRDLRLSSSFLKELLIMVWQEVSKDLLIHVFLNS